MLFPRSHALHSILFLILYCNCGHSILRVLLYRYAIASVDYTTLLFHTVLQVSDLSSLKLCSLDKPKRVTCRITTDAGFPVRMSSEPYWRARLNIEMRSNLMHIIRSLRSPSPNPTYPPKRSCLRVPERPIYQRYTRLKSKCRRPTSLPSSLILSTSCPIKLTWTPLYKNGSEISWIKIEPSRVLT